jgi:cytochrome P450
MTTYALPSTALPGPRGIPVIGARANFLRLYQNPYRYMRQLYETYGDVVGLARGDTSYVFVFGPKLNHDVLANASLYQNGPGPIVRLPKGSVLERLFLNNLAVMNGAHHKQQRKLMQPAFHRKHVEGYRNDMAALTQHMLDHWTQGETLDTLTAMKQLTQRIAVKTLFGVYNQAELDRVGGLISNLSASIASPLFLLAPFDIPGLPYYRITQLAVQLEEYIQSIVAHKRTQTGATDVLATLVNVRDEEGGALSDEELVGHAFTLFVAGHETTSNALTWALFLLHQHPAVAADLLDELDGVLHGDAPTIEQLTQLPLLDGVVRETLRLLPPAPIGVRIAAEACELGGYALPKGTTVFYNEFVTHRMPALYPDPDRFEPRRWFQFTPSPYEYLPFSAGPHMCIGWGFAIQEMKLVLAMIVQRYRLSIVPNSTLDPTIGMRPKKGLPVRVLPQDRRFERVAVRGHILDLVDLREQRQAGAR